MDNKAAQYEVRKNNEQGDYVLCKDNMWRIFVHYGTYPECARVYRVRGFAERKAKELRGRVVEKKKA
jgi:hypothetical protein